jgi:hypothetical protein
MGSEAEMKETMAPPNPAAERERSAVAKTANAVPSPKARRSEYCANCPLPFHYVTQVATYPLLFTPTVDDRPQTAE